MGIFYYVHSVALIEDLPLESNYKTPAEFFAQANKAYEQVIFLNHVSVKSIFQWTMEQFALVDSYQVDLSLSGF